jgi:hypothetical protein
VISSTTPSTKYSSPRAAQIVERHDDDGGLASIAGSSRGRPCVSLGRYGGEGGVGAAADARRSIIAECGCQVLGLGLRLDLQLAPQGRLAQLELANGGIEMPLALVDPHQGAVGFLGCGIGGEQPLGERLAAGLDCCRPRSRIQAQLLHQLQSLAAVGALVGTKPLVEGLGQADPGQNIAMVEIGGCGEVRGLRAERQLVEAPGVDCVRGGHEAQCLEVTLDADGPIIRCAVVVREDAPDCGQGLAQAAAGLNLAAVGPKCLAQGLPAGALLAGQDQHRQEQGCLAGREPKRFAGR